MISLSIPSTSGSTQTTAPFHDIFSSFSNQLSSPYPIPPNLLPYNPFPPYFLPVQQPVLPPSYPQAYLSSYPYMLQQGNDPTRAHAPSDFYFPLPTNPVHLNQQLPSHTNTPILHQSPSPSCEPHPPSPLTGGPPLPQRPRLDSSHLTSFNPTSTAVAHHSLAPPTPATTILSPQLLNTTATSQVTSYISSPVIEHSLQQQTSHSPLSTHPPPSYTPFPFTTTTIHSPASPSASATTPSAATGSSSAQVRQHSLFLYLQQYVQYLKHRYISKNTPVYDKEHSLLQVKVKSFINIALVHKDSPRCMIDSNMNEMLMDRLHGHVDAIQKKKTKLRMFDVCKSEDGRLARCVLVEGAPGVGKTTFAFELCKRWARGEILQEWPVAVVIKLRDHRTRTAQNMYDLLYHPRPEVQQAVVNELMDRDGKGMLLILDGYDELTDSQRDFNSVIQCLMSRELFLQSTLMVTSRPLATRTLHDNFVQSIDQHIEVLGFTEKNIEEYIQSACGDKPELVEDFKSYLSSHPFSSALMFNPLQCAIVTDLYRNHWESGDKRFAPKTLTELYTGLVYIMLLRYLTHHPVYKDIYWKIKDLSELPEEVSQQLTVVTKLAAKGIENQQYVFDDEDGNVPSETLGLMQREEVVTAGIGRSASYSFLHLTLQEYLTAVNYCTDKQLLISKLLERNGLFPLKHFLDTYGKKRKLSNSPSATHWPVVLFLAGRTKLSSVSPDILKKGLHNPKTSSDITEVDVSLLHLLYETQSPQLIQSTLVTSRKYLSVSGQSALDWFVIGYCVANSTGLWKLEKKAGDKHNYLDRLILGLNLAVEETRQKGKIGSLIINGYCTATVQSLSQIQTCYTESMTELKLLNPKHERGTASILDILAQYQKLEVLEIVAYDLSDITVSSIAKQNNLCTLSLSYCKISSGAIRSLMQSPHCKLRTLALHRCTISLPEDTQPTTTIMKTNAALHSLDISWSVLYQMMSCINPFTQSLTELILHVDQDTRTCTSGVETILQEIPFNCPLLETLKIVCDFLISLPLSIPQFIGSQQNILQNLSLRGCNLNSDVTRSLIHSLQSPHCRVRKLALHQSTISSIDHSQLVTAIVSSTTINFLVFSDMLIDTPSLSALASGLKHNVTLENLVIDKSASGFTEDQFRVLIDAVDSSAVKKLWLPTYYKQWLNDCPISRTNISIEWFHDSMNILRVFSSGPPLVQGHDEDETLQPIMDTAMKPAWSTQYKYKDRKSLFFTLDKRNEQLKKQDQLIIELKQKLKDKNQESEYYAKSSQNLQDMDKQTKDVVESDFKQEDFIHQLKQELKDDEVEVMENVKSKNEQLDVLLAENQLLIKQQTQEQEEQVAEFKQEWEGKEKAMNKLLSKQVKDAYTQSAISFPVLVLEDCHGPHVVGEKVFHIEGRAPQVLSWEEYGFRIRVQENITSGACDVTVKAIVAAGQIDLPEGCELVSAVYDISLSRKLTELITIEIEHCAKLENKAQCEYLSYVTAQHNDQFKLIKGGMFCPNSQYGALCCNSFSKKGVVKNSRHSRFDNELEEAVSTEPNQCSSHEQDSLHEANSHSVTVVDAPNVLHCDGEAATISTVSSERHDTAERDHSPDTIYNALVFDARDGQNLLWRFMVFNNLKAVEKFVEVSYMDKWREKSRKCFVFAGKYLVLDLPEKECEDGWQILPCTNYPYKIYEQEVKSNQFAYCQLIVVRDPQGSCLLHRKVPVKHMVTEDDPYAVYIVCSSSGFVQTSGNKRLACDGGHGVPVIRELMNRVAAPCMDQWELVGVQLDIDDAQLNSIRSSCRTDQQCFKKVFDLWRRKGSPPYTWATIINVLEAPSVGEGTVAKDVLEWLSGGENSSQ